MVEDKAELIPLFPKFKCTDKFMAIADEADAKKLIDEMNKIAQESFDEGVKLVKDLEEPREILGSKFKVEREDYFVAPPFG